MLTLGIWDPLKVIRSPESDYTKSALAASISALRPLAMSRPLSETKTTLATRVRRMVLGQVVALTRFSFSVAFDAIAVTTPLNAASRGGHISAGRPRHSFL